jgi:hypothetical protein
MRFTTLLPRRGTQPGHRPEAIDNATARRSATMYVRARVLQTRGGRDLLRLFIWTDRVNWVQVVLNDIGDLLALAAGDREVDAREDAEETLHVKGIEIAPRFRTLFTPAEAAFGRAKRSSLLVDDRGRWQVSARQIVLDEKDHQDLLQLRIWIDRTGWIALVLTASGDVVAHTIARTENDAWIAAQVILRRKGYIA